MSLLSEISSQLDSQIGFTERVRMTDEVRLGAINQGLDVVYGLLRDSPILKKTSEITIDDTDAVSPVTGIGTLPDDFNEGIILHMFDGPDFISADEVPEVDEQTFGRWDDSDSECFVRRFNEITGEEELHFKGVSTGTYYMEYEKGAPVLASNSDQDGLPRSARYAVAKVAAGILTDNVLADATKMQIMLYGPSGNPSRVSPDSVMGILTKIKGGRRIMKQRPREARINLMDGSRIV